MMTAQCVTRDQLTEYLSGLTEPEQSEAIEAHLHECATCEQAIAQLERGSDTFLDSVRRSQTQLEQADSPSAESQLVIALDRVKQASDAMGTSGEPPRDSSWPGRQVDVGSYEILRPIGQGGMGSVYLARHRQLGKQLAVKLLSTKLNRSGDYTARFQREMRAAGGLDHPAIVRATDAGEHDGTHYLAMEYIEGLDLSRIARLVGKFSVADACEIARQVALGLSHAHAAGVTHRDIKPSNVMLSTSGQVKILDFGLARLNLWDEASAELTTVGQLIGTLDYMAPEQADRPDSVDYRADLYALGATLFRLLCGRAPLAASPEMSPLAKLRLLATHQSPSLATMRSDAPEPLVRLLASLLARDPEMRPASAAHVAEELQTFAHGADLPNLVSRAQESAQNEPDEATVELLTNPLPSRHAVQSQANPVAAGEDAVIDAAANLGQPPRRPGRQLAWAFAPLALLAGVLITLETQKGNLVIESEADNVSVKLLRDGKPYDQLKIETGATATRLYAGKYEVTIDGSSDALVVDKQHIEVRRGETTIARIHQRPAGIAGAETKGPATQQAAPRDRADEIASLKQRLAQLQGTTTELDEEPLFNGKQLSYWLETIGRERSSARYSEALIALQAMLSPDNAQRIAAALLPAMRSRPTARKDASGDDLAFAILRKAYPGKAYYELLTRELETGSEEWHARVLYSVSLLPPDEPDTIEPLTQWLEKHVFAEGGRKYLLRSSTDYYHRLVRSNNLAEVKQRFAGVLVNCAALDDAHWLSRPANDDSVRSANQLSAKAAAPPQTYVTWYPPIAEYIEQVAIRTLGGDQADRKLLAQAIVILRVLNSGTYDRAGMQDRRSEVIDAAQSALKMLQSKPAFLYEEQKLATEFFYYVERLEKIEVLSPRLKAAPRVLNVAFNLQPEGPVVLTAVELLALVEQVGAGAELVDELVGVFDVTGQLSAKLYAREPEGILMWPRWKLLSPTTRELAPVSRDEWLAAHLHSTAYRLLPAEMQAEIRDAEVSKYNSQMAAAGKEIAQHDTDGDGNLSVEEGKGFLDDAHTADTDNNGFLHVEELIEFHAQRSAETRSNHAIPESAVPGSTTQPGAANPNLQQPPANAAAPSTDESIFNGRPLSYWLETVRNERNVESYVEALNALRWLLTSTANAQRITAELLPILRDQASPRTDSQGRNLDSKAFAVLSNANPDEKFYELITHELQTATPAWQSRIFKALEHTPDDPKATAPLTTWLEEKVFTQDEPSDLLYMSADYYRELIHRRYSDSMLSEDAKTHLASVLVNCKALDDSYWLSRRSPLIIRSGGTVPQVYSWHPLIGSHIEQHAIHTLVNPPADRKLYLQAIIILRTLNLRGYDRSEMPNRRAEIVEGLRAAFQRLQANPAELFEVHEFSGREFDGILAERNWEPVTVLAPVLIERAKTYQFRRPTSAPVVITSLELVALAQTLVAGEELTEELHWLFEATSALSDAWFAVRIPSPGGLSDWPELRSPEALGGSKVESDETPKPSPATREHWIAAMLHTEAYRALPEKVQNDFKRASVRERESARAAEFVRKHDADGDGKLSFEEAAELLPDPAKADADGDKHLSVDELSEFRTDEAVGPASAEVDAGVLEWAKRQVEKYDRNQDGSLTPDEWSAMIVQPRDADFDRNGRITAEEYARDRQNKNSPARP